jgi:hypothetical protein
MFGNDRAIKVCFFAMAQRLPAYTRKLALSLRVI